MSILRICNKIIEFSFYALFFLIPLIFWRDTSELYEFNKMWLTFAFAILIAGSWIIKIVITKKFYLQRTPLDIPIAIFLASQTISTIFSLDSYVSFWGYYSRFNGGLLSTIAYIFLYYSFLSNFDLKTQAIEVTKKILIVSLGSTAIVALWGLPSHFGYDPTCLLFRGSFDVSCWTSDFQPKIRIFSTLGQPDWLGAYLAILTPLSIAFFLNIKRKLYAIGFLILSVLFYVDILFTKSRSALLGVGIAIVVFGIHYILKELGLKITGSDIKKNWTKAKLFLILLILFLVSTALVFNPISLSKGKPQIQNPATATGTFSTGGGGTESGKIRLFVWQGALNAWIHNPIIGTGVETFAFAYYKYKPIGHNLTSEWNYLYNKAHNEYLNYLATSGIVGLLAYLFIIGTFFYCLRKKLNRKLDLLVLALLAGYVSILVTNFFGFSVVIVNIYFFLIPAFIFVFLQMLSPKRVFLRSFGEKNKIEDEIRINLVQKMYIAFTILVGAFLLLFLRNFWLADQAFSLGQNLARAGDYNNSYSALKEAVARVPFEPTYKDELSSDDAIFSVGLISNLPKDEKDQKMTITFAENLAKEAITYVNEITSAHPNNVVFWKTKVRVYYVLSQIDPKYTKDALDALEKAKTLAPNDPNIYYNLGLLYGQENDIKKAIISLKEAIKVKPNYEGAYYALGLFYREEATDKNGKVINEELNQKAIDQMEYILKHINPKSQEAQTALESFQK